MQKEFLKLFIEIVFQQCEGYKWLSVGDEIIIHSSQLVSYWSQEIQELISAEILEISMCRESRSRRECKGKSDLYQLSFLGSNQIYLTIFQCLGTAWSLPALEFLSINMLKGFSVTEYKKYVLQWRKVTLLCCSLSSFFLPAEYKVHFPL